MGLDMYLHRTITTFEDDSPHFNITIESDILPQQLTKKLTESHPSYLTPTIETSVIYWRKANSIHNWFIKKLANDVDDCRPIHVSIDDLVTLRDTCNKILEKPDDIEQMYQLLPPVSGFFFGDTNLHDPECKKYYLEDLNYTVEQIQAEIELVHSIKTYTIKSKHTGNDYSPIIIDYSYQASW